MHSDSDQSHLFDLEPDFDPDCNELFVLPLRMDYLVEWAHENGASLDPKVEVYQSSMGTSLRVKPSSDPSTASALAPHSRIVSAPYGISLSYLNALDVFTEMPARSPRFPQKFLDKVAPEVVGRFFLMQQHLMGESSFWYRYLISLPQPERKELFGTPMVWTHAEDLEILAGTNLEPEVKRRSKRWDEEFSTAIMVLMDSWAEGKDGLEAAKLLLSDKSTKDLYYWACTVFSSRSFSSALVPAESYGPALHQQISADDPRTWREKIKSEGSCPILFPLLDIANHSPTAKVEWFVDAQAQVRSISLVNDEEIPAGKQVFNNYAPKANSELLLGYGFIIPENDDWVLHLKCPEDKLALRRAMESYKASEETQEGRMFAIRRNPFPGSKSEEEVGGLACFQPGLLDMLCVLVANDREVGFLEDATEWSAESNLQEAVDSEMGRAIVAALGLLKAKLENSLQGLPELDIPFEKYTDNTETALAYREGQRFTIQQTTDSITAILKPLLADTSLAAIKDARWPASPLINLSSAFTYLKHQHSDIWKLFIHHILGYIDDLPSDLVDSLEKDCNENMHRDGSAVLSMLLENARQEEEYEEHYEACWAQFIFVILCTRHACPQTLTPTLFAWATSMLDSYSIRPVPSDFDPVWAKVKIFSEVFPSWGIESGIERYFEPKRKWVRAQNKRKPRCKEREGEGEEQAWLRCREDYWGKTAMLAFKIGRREMVRHGLDGVIGGEGEESGEALLFVQRGGEEADSSEEGEE